MAYDQMFFKAQSQTVANLESLQVSLMQSTEDGMLDLGDSYYNEIIGLIQEANLSENWDELLEVIVKGKTLEKDIAAWLARHGRTTVSFSWPYPSKPT